MDAIKGLNLYRYSKYTKSSRQGRLCHLSVIFIVLALFFTWVINPFLVSAEIWSKDAFGDIAKWLATSRTVGGYELSSTNDLIKLRISTCLSVRFFNVLSILPIYACAAASYIAQSIHQPLVCFLWAVQAEEVA